MLRPVHIRTYFVGAFGHNIAFTEVVKCKNIIISRIMQLKIYTDAMYTFYANFLFFFLNIFVRSIDMKSRHVYVGNVHADVKKRICKSNKSLDLFDDDRASIYLLSVLTTRR